MISRTLLSRLGILALITATLAAPSLAAAQQARIYFGVPPHGFSDVEQAHPFGETIEDAKELGLVKGNPDGTFAPDSTINRAEFATMVIASLTKTPSGKNCFTDVHEEWFAPYICEAKTRGIVSGYADGHFGPANNVKFVEAAQMIVKAYKLNISGPKLGEAWYKPAVVMLQDMSAIPTVIDSFDERISRAQTAEILWRMKTKTTTRPSKTFAALDAPLPLLNSCLELKEKLINYNYRANYNRGPILYDVMEMKMGEQGALAEDSEESAAPTTGATAPGEGGASDYSTTNVQVAGVDEGDVIKNDGQYIYIVSKSKVRIVRAYPPEQMAEVGVWSLNEKDFSPTELYVDGNKLVVLGSGYANGRSSASVHILDITDRAHPKEERALSFDGYTVSSRRIGSYMYLVVNETPDYYTILNQNEPIENALPHYSDSRGPQDAKISLCNQVHFVPDYQDDFNFITVAGINLDKPTEPIKKEVVLGAGGTVYASQDALYIAATRYNYPEVGIFNRFMPIRAGEEKTRLLRFALSNGDVTFKSAGEVPGHLLNQFSMDESNGAFRVAVTISPTWWMGDSSAIQRNALYVLDSNNLQKTLGSIQNIAPGEQIHSVRFMGPRAYMVTFKNIDPFFVIDLADPAAPKILGELKIPGFSDYLHPYDENHVIGFGKDAVDPRLYPSGMRAQIPNFAWYQGMKIALFDVTDVKNPKLQFNTVIGDRGTTSELLDNHKALFFDKVRGTFAFPITVNKVKDSDKLQYPNQDPGSVYGTPVFQGAYVYHVDLTNGFQLKGTVTHMTAGTFDKQDYYSDDFLNRSISRIISMGDYLYTISLAHIKALTIDKVEEVKSLDVAVDPYWNNEPIPMGN